MSTPEDAPTLGYEEARDELIDVVKQLEGGGLTLEQSITLWERGEELAGRVSEVARRCPCTPRSSSPTADDDE